MRAIGYGHTDVGRKRPGNEDAFLVDNDSGVFLVCDGLGGHAKGEVASNLAIQACRSILTESSEQLQAMRSESVRDSEIIEFAESLVNRVCSEIYEVSKLSPAQIGMGTTFTLLLILGGRALMAHIGDSRLYLLRDDHISQLSDDHSFVGDLIRNGRITVEEGKDHPHRNVVTRTVGTKPATQVDTLLFDLFPEDTLLLCSDGLTEYINESEDLVELIEEGDVADAPARLIEAANAGGGGMTISLSCLSKYLLRENSHLNRLSARER